MNTLWEKFKKVVFAVAAFAGVGATFAVTEPPEGYKRLEWIRSTGAQYIDTGYVHKESDIVDAVWEAPYHQPNTYSIAFGASKGDDKSNLYYVGLAYQNDGKYRYKRHGTSVANTDEAFYDQPIRVHCDGLNMSWKPVADATWRETMTVGGSSGDGVCTMYIFAHNSNNLVDVRGAMKLFSFTITSAVGPVVRDYVPVRRLSDGEVGLWERVEGRFFGNCGASRFYGSDEEAVLLNYVESSASQYVDTGITLTDASRIEASFRPLAVTGWGVFFGAVAADRSSDGVLLRYYGSTDQLTAWFCCASSVNGPTGMQGREVELTLERNRLTINGETTTFETTGYPFAGSAYVFAGNNNNAAWRNQAMRLYDFKISEVQETVATLVGDFIPYRTAEGDVGLLNRVDGSFHGNKGNNYLTYGLAFTMDGTTKRLVDGSLTVSDLEGVTALVKATVNSVSLDTPTLGVPLTLQEGRLVVPQTTAGTALTLTGGATLAFDVADGGNGSLTASAVTLANATAETPVKIEIRRHGLASLAAKRVLIGGGTLAAGDLVKFALTEEGPYSLAIQDGNLVLVPNAAPVAEAPLPAGYMRLAYVESTGSQWIDTGFTHGPDTVVDLKMAFTRMPAARAWFGYYGGRTGSRSADQLSGFIFNDNIVPAHWAAMGEKGFTTDLPVEVDQPFLAHLENGGPSSIDGKVLDTGTSTACTYSDYIFAINQSGTASFPSQMRLYSCTIATKTANGLRLERDFVPVLRESDNEIGLYDRVGNRFYGRGAGIPLLGGYAPMLTGIDFAKNSADREIVNGVVLTGTLTLAAGSLEVAEAATQEIRCGALALAGGTLAFSTLGPGTPEIKVAGAATVTGAVTVTVPPVLGPGTYSLVSAASFSLAGGTVTLAAESATGADGATRSLETTETGLTLVVGERTLPAGYTQLEGLTSSGTQWINTETETWELSSIDLTLSNNLYLHQTTFFGQDAWTSSRCLLNQQSNLLYFHDIDGIKMGAPPSGPCRVVIGVDGFASVMREGASPESYRVRNTFGGADRTLYVFAAKGGLYPSSYTLHRLRIATAGTLVRDFVPCRNPEGEAGLWDFVEGKFFGNQGRGRFAAADETAARLNYAASNGKQKVKLDYAMDENTTMEFHFGHPVYVNATAFFGLNWNGYCWLFNQQSNIFYFHGNSDKFTSMGLPEASARYTFTLGDDDIAILKKENSSLVNSLQTSRSITNSKSDPYLTVFACNTDGHAASYRFYSMDLGKAEGEPRTVTPQRQLRPYRDENGRVGLRDELSGTFYPGVGTEGLTYGYAYNETANGIEVYDGLVETEDAFAAQNVVKRGRGRINMGAVTEFTSLNVAEGLLDLTDGVARTLQVAGTFTLAGGTTLVFDVLPGGADDIDPTMVDLSGASGENPVRINLIQQGAGAFSASGRLALVARGLVAGDEAKFRVEGLPATLTVEDGALIATLPPNIPYTAIWTGQGDRTNLADPANWNCLNFAGQTLEGVIPTGDSAIVVGANTTFAWPRGQSLARRDIIFENVVTLADDCDWRGMDVPIDFTVALNGHKLYLSAFNGTGAIMDGNGYVPVEYIESSGTQYINTGYTFQESDIVDTVMYAYRTQPNGQSFAFGADYNDDATKIIYLGVKYGTEGKFRYKRNSTSAASTTAAFYGQPIRVHCEGRNMNWKPVDDENWYETLTTSGLSGNCPCPFYIFANNKNNASIEGRSAIRVYSFKISSSNGTLRRDYVPMREVVTGALGLWDRVEGKFYPNNGTGTFISGRILAETLTCGEVHLDVPAGATVANTSVKLQGALKLVKDGEGTFSAECNDQAYAGGTVVAAGTATTPLSGSEASTYAAKYFQWGYAGATITVEEGATFDTKGNYDYTYYPFELAGGTLANTGCSMSKSLADGWGGNGALRLTTNATYRVAYDTRHTQGVLDLGGYTLTMPIAVSRYFILDGTSVFANGHVDITSGGWLTVMSGDKDMRTVDFTLSCALSVQTNMYVRNLTMLYEGNYAMGSGQVFIGGVFTPSPTKNYSRNFVLQNKATLNLEGQSVPWTLKSALSNCTPVTFAESAAIGIRVGARRLHNREQLVAWPAGEGPGATFTLVDNSRFRLVVETDGVYCDSNGTILFLR